MSNTGVRGEIREIPARQAGHGTSRHWTRVIQGRLYSFTAVLMPSGERRYFANRFDGTDKRFDCEWTHGVLAWTFPPIPEQNENRAYVAETGQTATGSADQERTTDMLGTFDFSDSTDAATDHLTSVTRMLCHEEIVTLIRVHSGHFTDAAAIRIAGELADEPGKVVTCFRHGEACRIRSDSAAGYYFVTMTRADWFAHDSAVYPELYGSHSDSAGM